MWKRWLFVLVTLGLLAMVAGPVSAGPGGTDRPFEAEYVGAAHWEFPGVYEPGCSEVTTISDATGKATHLGAVEFASWHCPGEPDYIMDGYATIVAANGDELYVRYDYDPFDETNRIPITFDGGTGRFVGATGSGIWTYGVTPVLVDGCDDPEDFACLDFGVAWPWWSEMEGIISY